MVLLPEVAILAGGHEVARVIRPALGDGENVVNVEPYLGRSTTAVVAPEAVASEHVEADRYLERSAPETSWHGLIQRPAKRLDRRLPHERAPSFSRKVQGQANVLEPKV